MIIAMESVSKLLPPHKGLLPKWLLVLSAMSVFNTIQTHRSLQLAEQIYTAPPKSSKPEVTPLSSRTFGTWTLLSAIVRFYAAYHINEPTVYKLALWTYLTALFHFTSEWLVFDTARWGKGLASPVLVASGTTVWMLTQWRNYIK